LAISKAMPITLCSSRGKGEKICIMIVYVDDIVLTGNNPVEMKKLKISLVKEFEMKDLDELHYFLGIEDARSKKVSSFIAT
jgi:Reverse transcriptase (RNA-dependent DNA polymerase)